MSESTFTRAARLAFVLTVLYAGAMFWIAPHPPMADLPQHAGQVALWRDLLAGQSPWAPLLRINYFTPYLMGYGLTLALSFVMPIAAALKLLLMLAYYAFVFSCVVLRRHFHGDQRLDWLFIPGFFGLAYVWGLFSFLVAAPVGLIFVWMADRYSKRPTIPSSIGLCCVGFILFFSHALTFVFASAMGIAFVVLQLKGRWLKFFLTLLPYLPLGVLSITYVLVGSEEKTFVSTVFPPGIAWGLDVRRLAVPAHIFGGYDLQDAIFSGTATVLMFWAPRLLSSTLNWREPTAFIPMGTVLLVWLAIPFYALQTTLLYTRFALFLLPFYALMFARVTTPLGVTLSDDGQARIGQCMLAILCWLFLVGQTERLIHFAQESRDFEEVLAVASPEQRALTMVFDAESAAAKNPWTYLSYPLWYQAEKGGLVDFNFAWFSPQIVRYRNDKRPPVEPGWEYQTFNWIQHQGWQYRYFFVRNTKPLPDDLFKNDQCHVALLKSAGSWSIYEASRCQ